MAEPDDFQLLAEFARGASEPAFAAIVTRHVNLVHSTAFRCIGNAHHAEEITQAVFIILARKAETLSPRVVLSGWLYQTARLTAANFVKSEIRRRRREQEAYMQSAVNEPNDSAWREITPLLDEAMGRLGQTDRDAVVLRFFENKNSAEIGAALRMNEETARRRVNRALEKLRKFFSKRGVTLTATLIAGAMSAHSVQAAPVGMAKTISAIAITKGATASASTLTLIKGALKLMAWTKAKAAIVFGVVVILAAGTTTVIVKKIAYPNRWANDPSYWRLNNPPLKSYPPVLILRPTHFAGHGGGIMNWNRWLEKDAAIQDLVAIAYNYEAHEPRIIFPNDLPQGRPRQGYDLMLTLPNHPRRALREAIQKRFGLVGHTETIVTNVLLVKVANPDAPSLKPASPASVKQPGWFGENWSLTIRGQRLDNFLGGYIESEVHQPVFNETGLTGRYDLHLQWHPRAGETDKSAFVRALKDQLGLELVPTNMPIKMLVVKKVK